MSTTIVNTPPTTSQQPATQSNDSGIGFLIGIVILIVFGVLVFYYIFPSVKQMMNKGVQVNLPEEINVPAQVNVNVDQPE